MKIDNPTPKAEIAEMLILLEGRKVCFHVEEISFSPRDFVPCIYDCGKEPVSRADCADRRTRYSRMKSRDSAVPTAKWKWKVCRMRVTAAISGIKEKVKSAYTGKVILSGNSFEILRYLKLCSSRNIPSRDKVGIQTRIFLSTRCYYRELERKEEIWKKPHFLLEIGLVSEKL